MPDRPIPARLWPAQPHPPLRFDTLGHGGYDLAEGAPLGGTCIAFHRGSHCKWTRIMLKDLDDRIGDFALRGVRVVAVSCESRAATEALHDRMQLVRLPLGYGLDPVAVAAAWGLYLTADSREEGAPALHWEPAQFWLRADGTTGAAAVQSGPSLWPGTTDLLRAIDKTLNDFPERGGALLSGSGSGPASGPASGAAGG